MVPYIYEDYASHEDTVAAFMKVFEMTDKEKEAMKTKVTNYVDHAFSYEKIVKQWDAALEKTIANYKSQTSSWSLIALNPTPVDVDAESKPEELRQKQQEQEVEELREDIKKIATQLSPDAAPKKQKKKKTKAKARPRRKVATKKKAKAKLTTKKKGGN